MKDFLKKNKIPVIIISVLLVVVAAVVACFVLRNSSKEQAEKVTENEIDFKMYQSEPKRLGNPDDVGVMILDCDDKASFGNLINGCITRKQETYVQGTGALMIGSLRKTSYVGAFFRSTNISEYADGSIHMSLFVNDPEKVGSALTLEITSSGTYDQQELCWDIPSVILRAGWNELYLGIADAKVTGEVNFQALNYFRLRASEGEVGLELIMDNVYASHTKATKLGVKSKVAKASTKAGYLMDCDTLDGMSTYSGCVLAVNESERKEGTGSIAISGGVRSVAAYLKETNIAGYKDGSLCFWLYVNDKSYAQNAKLHVELTSGGIADVEEITWEIQGSALNTGWNKIRLGMLGGKKNGGKIDLTRVNYFRIWSNDAPKNLLLFLDAVRMEPSKTRVAKDGMILSCDTMLEMGISGGTVFSVTSAKGEYKEGKGAVKGVFKDKINISVNTCDYIDISDWSKEALHFWLYVDDVSKLGGDLRVELGSAGTYDVNEHQWLLNVGRLHNGWNDISMSFSSAHKSKDGGADFSKICWFRIYNNEKCLKPVTMILDDVRAVKRVPVVREKGEILDCDSPDGIASARYDRITNKAGEYKEGTGAFKTLNLGKDWFSFVLEDPVDISDYKKGALRFWLYIQDASVLNDDIRVELGSGGKADVNEFQWTVKSKTLKTGWNEITLDFAVITKTENRADLSKINWFRIYWNSAVVGKCAILDDVRAVQKPPKEKIAGMILDCDNLEGIASGKFDRITTEAGEHKEGTGAFKTLNLGKDWFQFVLEDPVDISAYEKGALHFWLYIQDASALNDDIRVELGSGGKQDVNEFQWRVKSTTLKTGWNEIILDFSDITKTENRADLSKINWFRIFWTKAVEGKYAILDDVRAVQKEAEEKPNPPEKEKISGTVFDCDSAEGLVPGKYKYDNITTKAGEYKEGTGAFKTLNLGQDWFRFVLKDPVDISAYEKGALHFWLYIQDAGVLNDDIRVELGSGGKQDVNEFQWRVDYKTLKTGWNEIALDFSDITKTENRADLSKINWFRIFWTKPVEGKYAILDDIRAVEKGFVLNCDSSEGISSGEYGSVTMKTGEYKQGIGAFKVVNPSAEWFKILLQNPVDISAYKDGVLHFWLYIENTALLKDDIRAELGSGGKAGANTLQWTIAKASLKNGWNELCLNFSSGAVSGDGGVDLSRVNWFRIYTQAVSGVTAILDDVRAVEKEQEADQRLVKTILNCDSAEGLVPGKYKYDNITTKAGEHKEGTGAFKTLNLGKDWFRFVLKDPVDISAYEKGALHFWLYIQDASVLNDDIRVELGSGGTADVNEFQWKVDFKTLKTGWNEISLDFSDITKTENRADLSKINWFRIWWNKAVEGKYAILDDICAVKKAEPKMILNCDSAEGLVPEKYKYDIITSKAGEYKEGTGAFKTLNLGQDWFRFVLKDPVDISAYEKGALHFWLYIQDAGVLNDDIRVELGSGGKQDVNEFQWRVKFTTLKTGWNEITLDFSDITKTENRADLSKINWFRIFWTKAVEGKYAILDDIRAVEK